MSEYTLFDLPSSPEQIGILLPSANLRRINFSALEYETARRAGIEYIKSYFSDTFNDWVASSGTVMFLELQASNVAKLSLRGDMLAENCFLPTATTESAVSNHLALINQKIKQQTPSVVDVEVSVTTQLTVDLDIDPGLVFQVRGPDGDVVYYELYRSPGDYTSKIKIPAGKRGVIAFGINGRFVGDVVAVSPGGINQFFEIKSDNILESPFFVRVGSNGVDEQWAVINGPLEKYGPNDKVVQLRMFSNRAELVFGDNVSGKAPLSGQQITISYRVGGGLRGRIGSNAINETRAISTSQTLTAPVQVRFRNLSPSVGGTDRESLEQAKYRAPRDFVVRAFASDRPASIVTDKDYVQVASTFSHPVFGTVSKAISTVRTGKNANLVEVYILAEGHDGLVTPSTGLKLALSTYLDEYNVNTDTVSVLDGEIKAIDIEMTVVADRNADATFVKSKVEAAIDSYFDISKWQMGQPFYRSTFIEAISSVDGVSYVDLFKPSDNILETNAEAEADSVGIGFNEVIVEGNRNINFYYQDK